MSILFQFLRAFGTGVTVYGIAIVLQEIIGLPFHWAVIILGVVTIIYDMLGGMEAVVLSGCNSDGNSVPWYSNVPNLQHRCSGGWTGNGVVSQNR